MTEVVTSFAASQQLNLSAQGRQGFGVSGHTTQLSTPTAESNALHSALAAVDKVESKPFTADLPARDPAAGQGGTGPSRPRVELKRFDVGLSPSEVVGTEDVLQRFDANGDGRVDMLESSKAALVRQNVFTFSGLAAAPIRSTQDDVPADLTDDQALTLARETGAAIAALPARDDAGLPRKFSNSLIQDPAAKKFFADAAAAEGVPSGVADAPKKYYGQGAEVVAGQHAGNAAQPPVKYADRAQTTVTEDGTGEAKYYDRVAQTEASENGGDAAADREKYSEKAQEIAAAYAVVQGEKPAEAPVVAVVTA